MPVVPLQLIIRGQSVNIEHALLDTGSVGTLFSSDALLQAGVEFDPEAPLARIRGVGGAEWVFFDYAEHISIGELQIHNLPIEVGAMDYGIPISGIVGMDLLRQAGAVINLQQGILTSAN